MKKNKVLIITYYWPPSGAIGVHRCLKFSKYLKRLGWDITIYTAKNADYPYFDDSNFKHIPEDITILKNKIVEPFKLFKIISGRRKDATLTNPVHVRDKKQKFIDKLAIRIRGNFFIPDARSLWIKPSVRFLSKYIAKNKIDAIISDGPPHTNTVIACKLSEKFNIPWLADFQDPWTQVDYYKEFKLSKYADKIHKKLEQKTFKTAKKITIASPTWKQNLEEIGAKNVDVIYWGYDEEDFTNLSKSKSDFFTISHAGVLGYDRNPETFLQVLNLLKKENDLFSSKLRIVLAGSVDYAVKQNISSEGLDQNTVYLGNIPRDKALELTVNSDILLLPLNKAENAMGRIPGKLFEQMRSGNPILCFGPQNCDVENIISNSNSGNCFRYDDSEGIKKFILSVFNDFMNNHHKTIHKDIAEFSVENQVKKISRFLNDIIKQ